jgi:hypothetical protein
MLFSSCPFSATCWSVWVEEGKAPPDANGFLNSAYGSKVLSTVIKAVRERKEASKRCKSGSLQAIHSRPRQ